ncbi:L,D-transpeptidase [Cyanobium sp. ATX-6F1]
MQWSQGLRWRSGARHQGLCRGRFPWHPHRWTVGRAVSHGCVRLYDEDVRALFEMVSVGTPVTVLR